MLQRTFPTLHPLHYILSTTSSPLHPLHCPAGYACETDDPEPLKNNCVDNNGDPYWAILARYLQSWQPDSVVGVWNDESAGHWIQETHPDQAVSAVIAVAEHNAQ